MDKELKDRIWEEAQKALAVVESCENLSQNQGAYRYINLYYDRWFNAVAIYGTIEEYREWNNFISLELYGRYWANVQHYK